LALVAASQRRLPPLRWSEQGNGALSVNSTHAARPVILFELNEVPYRVIDWYATEKPHSNIAKLLSGSRQCRTSVETVDRGLQPIVTWSSLHRGVRDIQHGVSSFGQPLDQADAQYPPIWRILADHGIRTGVFGSLLSYRIPSDLGNYAFYFPEPLANDPTTYPSYLSPLQEFNLSMTRKSGRTVSAAVDWKLAARIIPTLPKLGLTPGTCAVIARQLVTERVRPHIKGRRRSVQSMLAFDVFMKQLWQYKPAFSTFFTNHVASAQHRFWAALFPEDFADLRYDREWMARYKHEIEYAMDVADAFVGRLMEFLARIPEYILLVGSSMGQAAFSGEPNDSYLEIEDFPRFMQWLGFEPAVYARKTAMFPCYAVTVLPPYVNQFREKLGSIRINGEPIRAEHHDGGYSLLDFDYRNYTGPELVQSNGHDISFAEIGVQLVEDEEGVYLSGDHQPEGIFLIYDRLHPDSKRGPRQNVSILEIAPTVLKHFGIPIPAYMAQPSLDLVGH
jgi:hypothetical protein